MKRRAVLRIWGRVQGVNYRRAAQREANRLGITGFARNMPDDSVWIEVRIEMVAGPSQHEPPSGGDMRERGHLFTEGRSVLVTVRRMDVGLELLQEPRHDHARDQTVLHETERRQRPFGRNVDRVQLEVLFGVVFVAEQLDRRNGVDQSLVGLWRQK